MKVDVRPETDAAVGHAPSPAETARKLELATEIVFRWTAEILERSTSELQPEQDLVDELGATSVERLDIIVGVEREVGVEFSGGSLGDIRRIADLIDMTVRHLRPLDAPG